MNQLYLMFYTNESANATAIDFQMTVLIGKDECKEIVELYMYMYILMPMNMHNSAIDL